MGDTIATMGIGNIQLSTIKKARIKVYFPIATSGLLFFVSPIPNRKRDARCTNNLPTGAILQVWAKEQRLRKGFQSGGVCETHKKGVQYLGTVCGLLAIHLYLGSIRLGTTETTLITFKPKPQQVKILPIFESPFSAAEIRLIL